MQDKVQQHVDVSRDTLDENVSVTKMFRDERYSRDVNKQFVSRLAQSWDRAAAGVVYLSLRNDGRYAIIDGCHRVDACRQAEGENACLPARVYIDLSVQDEAALWHRYNRYRRQPTSTDVFRSRLEAGDPGALAIKQAVESADLSVYLSRVQRNAGDVVAVVALQQAFDKLGQHGLTTILKILHEAFPDDVRGLQAPAISGLSRFWERYGATVDRSRLIDVLQRIGATRLLSRANVYRSINLGMPLDGAWARVLWGLYNQGLRSRKLPDWNSDPILPVKDGR